MTPLTFGPAGRRLFGIFHAPATGLAPASAVLLCPPMGQELFRAQRFLMQDAWWTFTFPGLSLFLTVLALTRLGDELNRYLNPRTAHA